MRLKDCMKDRNTLRRTGLAVLVLAFFATWLVPAAGFGHKDMADAGLGFLYGVAIGSLLLSLRAAKHSNATDDNRS